MNNIISDSRGIPSMCSAHPAVLREALRYSLNRRVLIETTCNQVNQFGGYSGMTPKGFVSFLDTLSKEVGSPKRNLILGGDHLGPNVWKGEPAERAMNKSKEMIVAYVQAGYTKLHLDCSMRLADDPPGPVDPEVIAKRAASLAKIAEDTRNGSEGALIDYVIGTEVPNPGGATHFEESVKVTEVKDVSETIEYHQKSFAELGLQDAWRRVIAVVVQPGVEFGDDFVLPYEPQSARALSDYIKEKELVFEAHSTDYQSGTALRNLVQDRFAILKVGPALTFAYREAIFSLAMMENELFRDGDRSNVVEIIDQVMVEEPDFWLNYYNGTNEEISHKRKFSLSDRIRYYWTHPKVSAGLNKMMNNLSDIQLPFSLVSQFAPYMLENLYSQHKAIDPDAIISTRVSSVFDHYWSACGYDTIDRDYYG